MSFQGWHVNSANSLANEYAVKFLSYLIKLLTQSPSSADAAAVFHGAAFAACPSAVGTALEVGTLVPIDLGSGYTACLHCGQLLLSSALHHRVFIF